MRGLYGLEGGLQHSTQRLTVARRGLERPAGAGESPVRGKGVGVARQREYHPTRETGGKLGRPRSKAQDPRRPIAEKYREGTVKSTPARGVKQNLKPCAASGQSLALQTG